MQKKWYPVFEDRCFLNEGKIIVSSIFSWEDLKVVSIIGDLLIQVVFRPGGRDNSL